MSQKLYPCPCCGEPTPGRTTPIAPDQCARAYVSMRAKGLTLEAMLGEHRAVFDAIAPGFTMWLEQAFPAGPE